MNNVRQLCLRVLGPVGLAIGAMPAAAAPSLLAADPVARISAESYDLHVQLLYVALGVFIAVCALMYYSVYRYHRAESEHATPFHRNTAIEIVWFVIPLLAVLATAWPAARSVMGLNDTSNADITIKATGMQWKWGYDYVDGDGEGVSFFSNLFAPSAVKIDQSTVEGRNSYLLDVDNPVVVPVNKKIKMVLTADEVIHSWHVPALGVNKDVIPGFNRDTWFHAQEIGSYRGLCSVEACGVGRACVLIVVNVVSEADYKVWVDGKKREMAAGAANSVTMRSTDTALAERNL